MVWIKLEWPFPCIMFKQVLVDIFIYQDGWFEPWEFKRLPTLTTRLCKSCSTFTSGIQFSFSSLCICYFRVFSFFIDGTCNTWNIYNSCSGVPIVNTSRKLVIHSKLYRKWNIYFIGYTGLLQKLKDWGWVINFIYFQFPVLWICLEK